MSDPRPQPKETPATLFGALLMAVGGLMVALCGLCSAFAMLAQVAMLLNPGTISNPGTVIAIVGFNFLLVAIVGGVPILVGFLIFQAGRRMRRGVALQAGRDPDRRK